jgi:hypothetical protein
MKQHCELKRKTELKSHSSLKRSYIKRKPKVPDYNPYKTSGKKRTTKPKRSTYTKELRQYIHERDEYCRACGCAGDQVHHVIGRGRYKAHPEWYTFTDMHDERNLMWICFRCHTFATDDNAELERLIKLQEARFGPLRKESVA